MDEKAVPISAFVTPFGHFQWKYMPFVLRNAPATFQRLVQKVLLGLNALSAAYLDDMIIFTARRYAKRGICRRRVSVCLSVTLRYCIKTAKRRITQITPHDSPGTLVF